METATQRSPYGVAFGFDALSCMAFYHKWLRSPVASSGGAVVSVAEGGGGWTIQHGNTVPSGAHGVAFGFKGSIPQNATGKLVALSANG